MKQTAVEYLEKELGRIGLNSDIIGVFIKKAKEVEKEQIQDAYYNGGDDMCPNGMPGIRKSEQYYNETFKTN